MKKALSLFLCVLMCISCFACLGSVASAAEVTELLSVNPSIFRQDKITYNIKLASGLEGFQGTVVYAVYDPEVLKVETAGAATSTDRAGNVTNNFTGEFACGDVAGEAGVYSLTFVNSADLETVNVKDIFTITFSVISEDRPKTSVQFFCKEFMDVKEENNIKVSDGLQQIANFSVSTLSVPTITEVGITASGLDICWEPVTGATGYEILRNTADSAWETVGYAQETDTVYTDSTVESGVEYIYSIVATNKDGESGFDSAGYNALYIAKPQCEVENGDGCINVSWEASAGAEKYSVLRKVNGEENWSKIGETAKTSYVDTNVASGSVYEYDIVAIGGNVITPGSENGMAICFISTPTVKTVVNDTNGIVLTWRTVVGAVEYQIFKKYGEETDWTLAATVPADEEAKYLDMDVASGETYYYAVKAVGEISNSALAEYKNAFVRVPATVMVSTALTPSGVMVEWQGVEDVTGYKIYRKTSTATVWSLIGSVTAEDNTYEDTSVKSGLTYDYTVTACIGTSESTKTVDTLRVFFLKAPEAIVKNVQGGLSVSWNVCDGAESYVITRKGEDDLSQVVGTVDSSVTAFIDSGVENGECYRYSVKAVSSRGNSADGEFCDEVCFLPAPADVKAKIATNGIEISWESVDVANEYTVYRKTKTGSFVAVGTTVRTSYVDTTVSNNNSYQYCVVAVCKGLMSAKSETTDFLAFLAAPENIKVTYASDGLKVTWDKVAGASKYRVYKKFVDDDNWVKVADTTSLNCTITDLTSGKEYGITVRAINSDGEYGALGDTVAYIYLAMPTVSVAGAYGGISVKWSKIAGANTYRIYRKTGDGSWTTLDTVDSDVLSFTDTTAENGKTYYYTVAAFAGSYRSAVTSTDAIKYVLAPKITSVANVSSGITVKWGKVSGASRYYLYRKTGNETSWTRIATPLSTSASYTDKDVTAGTKYTYTIRTYTKDGSSGYNTTGWTCVRMTASTVKVANAANGVKVTWSTVKGATSYIVYRKLSTETSWTKLATLDSSKLAYSDTTAVSGKTYVYTVKGANGSSTGLYKNSSSLRYLAAPKISSLSNDSNGITVKWGKVSGATGYYIYRKEGNASSWSKVASTAKTSYTDKEVTTNKKYSYTIVAYYGSAKSSYDSAGVYTYRLATPTVKVANAATGVKVSWNAVTGADSYIVYRKVSGGSWTALETTTGKSYIDTGAESDTTYIYTVRPVSNGVKGQYKESESIYYLSAPVLTDAVKYGNAIRITWDIVPGATGYTVYRKAEGESSWETLGKTSAESYKDSNVSSGVEYTYTVRAMKDGKLVSSYDPSGITYSMY